MSDLSGIGEAVQGISNQVYLSEKAAVVYGYPVALVSSHMVLSVA